MNLISVCAAAAVCTAVCSSAVFAESTDQYAMHVSKAYSENAESELYKYVGVNKITGEPIPFSSYADGYFYAYVPAGTEAVFKRYDTVRFADVPDDGYMSDTLNQLHARGIVNGDENGNFNGEEILTRAQMAAVLARLINADAGFTGEMPFNDVSSEDWFAPAVYALYSRGIIYGDDYFNPDRNVTREEFTAMKYRLISAVNAKQPDSELDSRYILDFGDISDYAAEAYKRLLGSGYDFYPLADVEYTDDTYTQYAYRLFPKENVTRAQACENLLNFSYELVSHNAPAIPDDSAEKYGFDKEMPVITGSTSTYPITDAVYRTLFINHKNHPLYPKSHDKTIKSYELLIDGAADIILVPDPNESVTELAKEKNVKLEYVPFSNEALIFFTSSDNTAEGLTSEDIRKIYTDNSITVWREIGGPDAKLTPFCRNSDSGSHAQLEKFFLGGSPLNKELAKNNTISDMLNILSVVAHYSEENPNNYALGYNMYYYYKRYERTYADKINLLSIDGTPPNDETIADGSYPLTTNYYAVFRADEPENSPARRMAAFLTAPEGQDMIRDTGFGALIVSE